MIIKPTYTLHELADALRIPRAFLHSLSRVGRGPMFTRINGRNVITRKDAEQFVKSMHERKTQREVAQC